MKTNDIMATGIHSSLHRVMQRRSPAARAFNSVATGARTNSKAASSELEDRASLIAFAWNIRDIVSSNISVFEEFTPDQMKEFAANMANAFEKFTLELEAITQERDEMRRSLDESRLLLHDREQVSLTLSSTLAEAHASIATHIHSLQLQLRALSTALVLNTSSIMSVTLPEKGDRTLSPVVRGDGSFLPLTCVQSRSRSASGGKEKLPDFVSKDIKVSKIDVPRIWFHCCSPQNAENGSSLLRPFLSQKNQMLEEVSTQQQRDLNDTPALLQDNMSVKIEQARKLLQDSPVIQSLQHHMEQQAQLVNEVLQEATSCSTWMIDDIMGEDALVAKARIGGVGIRPVLLEDVQHVCNIVSDSFEACAALHVYAAAAAVDRHNNTIEFTQQSESFAKMVSELKILRLELAKRAESITARDSEIELLRDQLERLAADFVSSQGLQLELQNAMTQNAALRDRIQKLEMRILEQPIKTHRQRPEVSQQIECLIYIAKVDFKGDGPHQLPLRKDDKVAVFVEDGLGWARGICNGRLGLFPSIICEKTSQVELVTLGGDHLSSLEGAFARTFSQSK